MNLWSRRKTIAGAAAGIAALGGALAYLAHPFARRYAPTPYDDLIAHLVDRDAGARVGEAVLSRQPGFDVKRTAASLRAALRRRRLATLDAQDIEAGRMVEADGWVLPQTLALLCAVTAKA